MFDVQGVGIYIYMSAQIINWAKTIPIGTRIILPRYEDLKWYIDLNEIKNQIMLKHMLCR